jgi:hypothetical protein
MMEVKSTYAIMMNKRAEDMEREVATLKDWREKNPKAPVVNAVTHYIGELTIAIRNIRADLKGAAEDVEA